MFVFNPFRPDVRVLKEAKTLLAEGFNIYVLAVKDKTNLAFEEVQNIKVIRVEINPIHYRLLKRFKSLRKIKVSLFKLNQSTRFSLRIDHKVENIVQESLSFQASDDFLETTKADLRFTGKPICFNDRLQSIYLSLNKLHFIGDFSSRISLLLKSFSSLLNKLLRLVDYYLKCFQVVRELSADFYHAHDFNTLPLGVYTTNRLKGKLIYDAHELYPEISGLTSLERFFYSKLESFFIQKCDHVITVNKSIGDELVSRYKIAAPSILMNCPELPEELEEVDGYNLIREELGIDQTVKVILYQGGFSQGRGIENLILAMNYLSVGVLVLMGWGKTEDQLRKLVKQEALNHRVFFLPPVSQEILLKWTGSADVGVIPYRVVSLNNYYSCPNKLFEYICAGIPVASSKLPEITKVLDDWGLGLTFNPESPEDIANSINSILSVPEQYQKMRRNACTARRSLCWAYQGKKLQKIYHELNC